MFQQVPEEQAASAKSFHKRRPHIAAAAEIWSALGQGVVGKTGIHEARSCSALTSEERLEQALLFQSICADDACNGGSLIKPAVVASLTNWKLIVSIVAFTCCRCWQAGLV